MQGTQRHSHAGRYPGELGVDTPPAAVGKNHHQADIDLASKKAQGLTGASASALGTTETEAGKRM